MSWSMLFGEAFVVAVVLILPGMLASRAFGVPFKQSLSFGPAVTVFFLVFMGIALRFISVAEGYFALLISFLILFNNNKSLAQSSKSFWNLCMSSG